MSERARVRFNLSDSDKTRILAELKDKINQECLTADNYLASQINKYPIYKIYQDKRFNNSLLRVKLIQQIFIKRDDNLLDIEKMLYDNKHKVYYGDKSNKYYLLVYILTFLVSNTEIEDMQMFECEIHNIEQIEFLNREQIIKATSFIYPDAFSHSLGFIFLSEEGEKYIHNQN